LTDKKVQFLKDNLDNPMVRNKLSDEVAKKVLTDDCELDYHVSKINFFKELERFLAVKVSAATRNNYRNAIDQFVKWCEDNSVKPLLVTPSDVDRYQGFLSDNGYANTSMRVKICGVSSFYTYLLYRHSKVFKINPFGKRKLPPDICKKPKRYITDKDITAMKNEYRRIGRLDMVCVVDLLTKYGFRVGCFSTMTIDGNGRYSFVSKGKTTEGKFTKQEYNRIIKYRVLDVSYETLKNITKEYAHKLYLVGKVSCDFSIHDYRRYYINVHANKLCNDVPAFIQFSRSVHANINTTMRYVS
jgi:hypothetical protein